MSVFECQFCLRVMKSERGLSAHQRQNECCLAIQKSLGKGRTSALDSGSNNLGKIEKGDQSKGLFQQKLAIDAGKTWRPSKIQCLLGEFSMHQLLTMAEGDVKRVSLAMSCLQSKTAQSGLP